MSYWLMRLLAVLVFIVPAARLAEVWPQKAPPAPAEVDHAHVEHSNSSYLISLPSGARYEVNGPNTNGSDKTREALDVLRSQIAGENASFRRSWAEFWFFLAGAFGAATLLILISRAIHDAQSPPGTSR